MIHGILFVQFTSLTVLSDNLSPDPLWSSPWSWTLSFILHTFLHPIIIIFSQRMPIPTQPVLLQIPMLCHLYLVSLSAPYLIFSFLTGQVSLPCSMLLCTQLLYNLPLIIRDTSLLVSSGTSCLNLFQPIRILASTATSASPSTLSMSPR